MGAYLHTRGNYKAREIDETCQGTILSSEQFSLAIQFHLLLGDVAHRTTQRDSEGGRTMIKAEHDCSNSVLHTVNLRVMSRMLHVCRLCIEEWMEGKRTEKRLLQMLLLMMLLFGNFAETDTDACKDAASAVAG